MRFLTCKGKDNLLDRLYMIINASPRVVTKYKKTRVLFFLRLFHDAYCWGNFKFTYLVQTSFPFSEDYMEKDMFIRLRFVVDSLKSYMQWYIQMKAIERDFPVVLFTLLCKGYLALESVNDVFRSDHSNSSYWAVLSCGDVSCTLHYVSYGWILKRTLL